MRVIDGTHRAGKPRWIPKKALRRGLEKRVSHGNFSRFDTDWGDDLENSLATQIGGRITLQSLRCSRMPFWSNVEKSTSLYCETQHFRTDRSARHLWGTSKSENSSAYWHSHLTINGHQDVKPFDRRRTFDRFRRLPACLGASRRHKHLGVSSIVSWLHIYLREVPFPCAFSTTLLHRLSAFCAG